MEIEFRDANPTADSLDIGPITSEEAEDILFGLWLRYCQCKKAKQISLMTQAQELGQRLSKVFAQKFDWVSDTWFDDRCSTYPNATLTLRFPNA